MLHLNVKLISGAVLAFCASTSSSLFLLTLFGGYTGNPQPALYPQDGAAAR